jgi:hypothetical protein
MNREIWKKIPIKILKDYEVSNFGRIRSLKFNKIKIMSLTPYKTGHKFFGIWVSKNHYNFHVGRIVLISFVGLPKKGQECSHLDGISGNNHLENLVWETHKENMGRTIIHGTSVAGDKNFHCKWGSTLMRKVKEMLDSGERPKQVAYLTGVSLSTVYNLKCGVNWRSLC